MTETYAIMHRRLTDYMRANGLKLTRQREQILSRFLELGKHVTVEELLHAVREVAPGVGHATIYRTMKLFVDSGVASERHFLNGPACYEPGEHHEAHHDHLICTRCRSIVEFENEGIERLQDEVAASHGFELMHHKMELYGLCPACREA